MPSLISDETKALLVEQVGHELYNSNFYMRISAFLNGKGFKNIAKHFEQQIKEEQEHSRIIYKLLTDLGEDFMMPEIDSVDIDFSSVTDLANAYLEREVETTENLNDIKLSAENSPNGGCPVVAKAMSDMILLQQAELDEATDFADKAQYLQQWWQVQLWDISLGE